MVLVNKAQQKLETDCWILATGTFSGNFDQNKSGDHQSLTERN